VLKVRQQWNGGFGTDKGGIKFLSNWQEVSSGFHVLRKR
jgi:hypothetical protein